MITNTNIPKTFKETVSNIPEVIDENTIEITITEKWEVLKSDLLAVKENIENHIVNKQTILAEINEYLTMFGIEGEEPMGQSYVDRGDVVNWDFDKNDFVADGNWHELDLSNIVPDGVTVLDITIAFMSATNGLQMAVRNADYVKGCNMLITNTGPGGYCYWAEGLVTCNASKKVKYYLATGTYTTIHFLVRGWFIQ